MRGGQADRIVAIEHQPNLARLRSAVAPARDVQVLERPAVGGEDARQGAVGRRTD